MDIILAILGSSPYRITTFLCESPVFEMQDGKYNITKLEAEFCHSFLLISAILYLKNFLSLLQKVIIPTFVEMCRQSLIESSLPAWSLWSNYTVRDT